MMDPIMESTIDYGRIIGLTLGAVIGAVVGWATAEVLIYQLIEKPKEEYDEYDEVVDPYSPEEEPEPVVMTREEFERKRKGPVISYSEAYKKGKSLKKDTTQEELEEEMYDAQGHEDDEEDDDTEELPHVITQEEWEQNAEKWESINFDYYEEDNILCDMQDKVIKNPELWLGYHALSSFGEGTSDPDTVFVKNPDEKNYYEVSRIHASYYRDILGKEEPQPKAKRKRHIKSKPVADSEEEHAARKLHAQRKAKLDNEPSEE